MIFTRKSDAALASLVKQLDQQVTKHKDDKLKAFVNLLGEDRDALETDAEKLVSTEKIKSIPIVVPAENENGPENYGLNPDAELTVLLYRGMEVKANHAFGPGEFDKKKVKAVLDDLSKILKSS